MNNEKNPENKRYKPSKYNFFFDADDGTHLAFNAISGAFAEITKSNRLIIHKILKMLADNTRTKPKWVEDKLWNDLLGGKFIIEENENELELLKLVNLTRRFNSTTLSLAIAPTLACNFKCAYCYAEKKNGLMNEIIQASLLRFIEKKTISIKSLHIGWIGGEPLLSIDVIENLSNQIAKICKDRNIVYTGSIVTNGYLLTAAMFTRLLKAKIGFIQITIDGPEIVHDKRRVLIDGSGTFKVIIENIKRIQELKQYMKINNIKIGIRVNIDKANAGSAIGILEVLDKNKLKETITIEPAPVAADTNTCKSIANTCLPLMSYYRNYETPFIIEARRKGFNVNLQPEPLFVNCMAVAMNTFVIDPNGLLYKCWNDCGLRQEAVGYLNEQGHAVLNRKIAKWLLWHPFDIPGCRECKILPLCLGGCPYKKMHNIKSCTRWKYSIKEILNFLYKSHQIIENERR